MHASALKYGELFFDLYCHDLAKGTVLDIGAQNVNGSLKEVCPESLNYIGVDFVAGNGVDVILEDPYKLPFEAGSVDVVVCSSCFEHSQFFWLLFLEMVRTLKPGGLLYLNVPSNGMFHRYPVDCWRFYPDAGQALAAWANREGYPLILLESFIGEQSESNIADGAAWHDFVSVFCKVPKLEKSYHRITDQLHSFTNAFSANGEFTIEEASLSPDHVKILALKEVLKEFDQKISSLNQAIGERDARISRILSSTSWRLTGPLRFVVRQVKRMQHLLRK